MQRQSASWDNTTANLFSSLCEEDNLNEPDSLYQFTVTIISTCFLSLINCDRWHPSLTALPMSSQSVHVSCR